PWTVYHELAPSVCGHHPVEVCCRRTAAPVERNRVRAQRLKAAVFRFPRCASRRRDLSEMLFGGAVFASCAGVLRHGGVSRWQNVSSISRGFCRRATVPNRGGVIGRAALATSPAG